MLTIIFLFVTFVGFCNCDVSLCNHKEDFGPKHLHDTTLPTTQLPFSNLSTNEKIVASNSNSQNWDQYLEVFSIIYGLAKLSNRKLVSEQCFKDMKQIQKGILNKDPWAMKVLDSSGQKESGFIWGHEFWLGSRGGCASVQTPLQITFSSRFKRITRKGVIDQMAPFNMDYRVIYMKHYSPWQIDYQILENKVIHIGLCLPSSCSASELMNLTQTFMDDDSKFKEANYLELKPKVLYVKDLKLKDSFFQQKSFKITIILISFTLIMMILAWIYSDTKVTQTDSIYSKVLSFIKCFDVKNNTQDLFHLPKLTKESIPVINGIRSVTCFWIISGHLLFFMRSTISNAAFTLAFSETLLSQPISAIFLLVDIFFTISGFLQTYNFLKNEKTVSEIQRNSFKQNAMAYGKLVFHRYLRLAPLEIALIPFVALFTSYITATSVFHISERCDKYCAYWWRNALFIQNFFNFSELCMLWSWSLACDMQFFCLMTIISFVYTKHPEIVKKLMLCLLIASIAWTYVKGLSVQYTFGFDVINNTTDDMYSNPFVRIIPYFMGSIAAWFFIEIKGNLKISPNLEKFLWNLTLILIILCINSNYKRDFSPFVSTTILIASRLAIAFIVCWMIFESASGRGTSWSRFLEHKIFYHINRLSYGMYLLNAFIIIIIYTLSDSSTYVNNIQMCAVYLGFIVLIYLNSIIFWLAFEIPYTNLSRLLLKGNLKKE